MVKLRWISRWVGQGVLAVLVGLMAAGPACAGERLGQADPLATTTVYLPWASRSYTNLAEWTQEAGNAQRTGYINIEPAEPWTLLWTWNGPDGSGGTGNHFYNAPREARTVAGGGSVFVPAGANGLYALASDSGQARWNLTATTFNATPAYDPATGMVFAGGADGKLYKVNAATGAATTYTVGSPVNRAVLVADGFVYALAENGQLHKVNAVTLAQAWVYSAGSDTVRGSGLAYSASRDVLVFGTSDLYVHAVNNSSGTQKWKVKPTSNPPTANQYEYRWYWPVVADSAGVVFLRMRLEHNAGLWGYTGNAKGIWPNSNGEARTFLNNNAAKQNLFALNLDDGTKKFIPAVGYGGTEDLCSGQACLTTGPLPVVRSWADGKQVAYIPFRNGQSNPPDGRWDSHMGEMVLDGSTISGLAAGDLRFVRMSRYNGAGGNSYIHVTDELNPITMAGTTLFHAHWGASEAVRITDRASSRGLSYSNPIVTANRPAVIRRQASCGNFNATTHSTTCGLTLFGDGRYWDGPGFWTYWNTFDPPTPTSASQAYSDGMRPRYTYVSGKLLVMEGNGGELMVFRHSGP